MTRFAILAVTALVLFATAAPGAAAARGDKRTLEQIRAQVAPLKAQIKVLKLKTRDLRTQTEALEELTDALEAQTAALEEQTGQLSLDLGSVVTLNPVSSLNNWIHGLPGTVPLTLQGSGADLQRWVDLAGRTAARMDRNGVLTASGLDSEGSLNILGASQDAIVYRQPLVNYLQNGVLKWQSGLDVANSENDDFVVAARGRDGGVFDVIYLRDTYPEGDAAVGIGLAPPLDGFRTQIGSPDESDWGALLLRIGENGTGDPLRVIDSAGKRLVSIDRLGRLVPPDDLPLRVLGDLRVRTTDIEDPSGLSLNGNPTDTSTDFRIRNLFDPELSTYVFQIMASDGRVFAEIRQDTGEVRIVSGVVRLGNGTLVEENGALRWIEPDGTVTTLAGGEE